MQPRFVVLEDGTEYVDRFQRFLGGELRFARCPDMASALATLAQPGEDAQDAPCGLLLDLDFRRIPAEALVDEAGRAGQPRSGGERQRLAEVQGILILRALRAAGVRLPALLFADLADRDQARFLEASLAPLTVIPSSVGLPEIRDHLRRMARLPAP